MGLLRKEIKKAARYFKRVGFASSTLTIRAPGSRTVGAESSGTNPTSTDYPCLAMVETKQKLMTGTLVKQGNSVITIIGGTLPVGIVPIGGRSTVVRAGVTYRVVSTAFDPDAAVFECEVSH